MFPLMVHKSMVTEPPETETPPPYVAVLPVMVHEYKVTVPL